jgi:hypothetical protein
VETGGLRWGSSFVAASNVTWPFARILISRDRIQLTLIVGRSFEFRADEVQQLRRRKGLIFTGVVIEHRIQNYPSFILYWTLNYTRLANTLRRPRLHRCGLKVLGSIHVVNGLVKSITLDFP